MNKGLKQALIVAACVAVAIAGWFTLAAFFGPDSDYETDKRLESLRRDSVELSKNHFPQGEYSYVEDVCKKVSDIQSLGDPLRFGRTDLDSARLFSNPRLAALANHNMSKRDSVMIRVMPAWRLEFARALNRQLGDKYSVDAQPDGSVICVYSLRYLDTDKLKEDHEKYSVPMSDIGFKRVRYSLSPESDWVEYDL